ncbi:MAG: hypothetical protein ACPGXL_01900 [Chitinophagales bacterium]
MIKRPFEQWLFEDVEMEFGIKSVDNMPALEKWLSITDKNALSPTIEKLRLSLLKNVKVWNEDELKMMFIAPFLVEFDFNHLPVYRVFTQRHMTIKTKTIESSGRVEWMVATGQQRPRKPFFFIQECKPEKTSGNDPLGQLLIAMVDAQSRNDSIEKLLYGCYTIGRFWFFVLLQGKEYGISRAYDATQTDDLTDMVVILKRVEQHIHKELNLPISNV